MIDLLDLTGKKILITGGAGAIGREVVRVLAEHGAAVAVNDVVSPETAAAALAEAGASSPRVSYFQADTTQPAQVANLFDRVTAELGQLDVVCCHAGMVEAHPVEAYPLEEFDTLININLRASFIVAQAAAKRWIAAGQPGHLIFTTSWVQDVPWPEITPYTTSKSGLKALMRGFARELVTKDIRANAIAPGIVAVGLAKRQWDTDPGYRARAEKAIPLGYMFLCSPMAAYMTGSVLLVDGGCSLYPMD